MEDSNHDFTDGAITGALYTLTERVENIYKIKTIMVRIFIILKIIRQFRNYPRV